MGFHCSAKIYVPVSYQRNSTYKEHSHFYIYLSSFSGIPSFLDFRSAYQRLIGLTYLDELKSEAATGDVLCKEVSLKILQNSQEKICARVSF